MDIEYLRLPLEFIRSGTFNSYIIKRLNRKAGLRFDDDNNTSQLYKFQMKSRFLRVTEKEKKGEVKNIIDV